MSEQRIEVVRRALDALDRRDLPGLLEQVDPSFELNPLVSVWPQPYRGRDGIEEWWRDLDGLWDEFTMHADDFRDLGDDTLLVLVHWSGRPKGGDTEVAAPGAALVRFRGDKPVAADFYLDEARALEAFGAR